MKQVKYMIRYNDKDDTWELHVGEDVIVTVHAFCFVCEVCKAFNECSWDGTKCSHITGRKEVSHG